MSRLAGDMKGFVVLGVYRSTVKKQNKEKALLWPTAFGQVHTAVLGYSADEDVAVTIACIFVLH